tara:strand:- start:2269 stop:2544 length:276 start_codon:yes stop_codon:yes gene_type:complete
MSWSNLQNKPKGAQLSIDGFYRTIENESRLNQEVDKLFSSELGIKVLDYLKSITIDAVAGRDISNDQLRHLEGMRYLYFIIKKRIESNKEV